MLSTRANAAVIINVTQNGPNVQILGTGTLNLDSVIEFTDTLNSVVTHNFNARNSEEDGCFVGVFPTDGDIYNSAIVNISGASSTSEPIALDIGGDSTKGVFVNSIAGGRLIVHSGYVSNTSLEFTAFITNYNFTDYGFSDGDSIIVSWSNGAVNESLTMNFIIAPEPEPSTITLGSVMLVAADSRGDENIVNIPATVSGDLTQKSIVLRACNDLSKNIWENVGTYSITNTTTMLCETNALPTRFYQAKIID